MVSTQGQILELLTPPNQKLSATWLLQEILFIKVMAHWSAAMCFGQQPRSWALVCLLSTVETWLLGYGTWFL